jgi:hypothetical protein
MLRWNRLVSAAGLALLLSACGGTGPATLVENVDQRLEATAEGDFAALVSEGLEHWENRLELEHVQAAIGLWEQALTVPTPEGQSRRAAMFPVLVNLSKAYYWTGHAFLKYDAEAGVAGASEALLATYERGLEYASLALAANNAEWTRQLQLGSTVVDAISVLTPDDVPAMYWYATNLGRYGLVRGITTVLARVDDIRTMMTAVESFDADYFYGAPDRYFGVYYTKLPFPGGDLVRSRERFESAIARFPQYLESRVLFGEDFAQVAQDRAVAEEHLRIVVETDVDTLPAELRPENLNAQRRARMLLDNLDEYFR